MLLLVAAGLAEIGPAQASKPAAGLAARLDAYLDARFAPPPDATAKLVKDLRAAGVDAAGLEQMLRAGRAEYPDPPAERGKLLGPFPLPCDHVDHTTSYLLYVPKGYTRESSAPLLVVGHGGSAARDLQFGARAARSGVGPWLRTAEKAGTVVLAPLTDRGWGWIGNSILFSAISKCTRELRIDPDRVYLTGHSMGGHLSWRTAISLPDRFAAISPMSGGYDYVKDKQVYSCWNVPGYATWGSDEPYQITEFNRVIAEFMEAHRFDWINREKRGGHQIFPDEIPKVWQLFADHPRDLYRKIVFARAGAQLEFAKAETNPSWDQEHTWRAGRPIAASTFHWLRLHALPADTPPERAVQVVRGGIEPGNKIVVTAENASRLTIYLHPKMVDFNAPVQIVLNGTKVHEKRVAPDLGVMLELVREFDDRGRVFWAKVEVQVAGSRVVGEPGV